MSINGSIHKAMQWEVDRPPASESVIFYIINVIKTKVCCLSAPPSPLQFGARDLGFSFLGSGGEPTKVVGLDQKFEDQNFEDESGTVRRER